MASRTLRITEHAELELHAAFRWYLARNPRAAEAFQTAVESCFDAIHRVPASAPEIEPGVRRQLVLRRFPHAVVYLVTGTEALVLAVAHLHRRPGYWRRRSPPMSSR